VILIGLSFKFLGCTLPWFESCSGLRAMSVRVPFILCRQKLCGDPVPTSKNPTEHLWFKWNSNS